MPELPRWKCHKEVGAFRITSIDREEQPPFRSAVCKGAFALGTACGRCERCEWVKEHPHPLYTLRSSDPKMFAVVSSLYIDKHKPHVGGYLVEYDDGYLSFSPGDAFDDGYARIP